MIVNRYGVSLKEDENVLKVDCDDKKSLERFTVTSYLK